MLTLLSAQERAQQIPPGWAVCADQDALEKSFQCPSFEAAWALMNEIAHLATQHNHHPTLTNSYRRVHVCLTTHDVGGLSQRDIDLANAIDRITGTHSAQTSHVLP